MRTRSALSVASAAIGLVATLVAVPLAGAAGGGALDPAFGHGGKVVTSVGTFAMATSVAVQADRKLVVAGVAGENSPSSRLLLARYLPTGALDPGFGRGGVAVTDLAGGAPTVALQRGGGILVRLADRLLRFLPDGSPDAAFGEGGAVPLPFAAGPFAHLLVRPDGRIVVAGNAPTEAGGRGLRLVGFRPDGAPDTSFGRGGTASAPADWTVTAAELAPDGRIVLAGAWMHPEKRSSADSHPVELVAARFRPGGTLDPSFGRAGVARHRIDPSESVTTGVAVQPGGSVVVGGRSAVTAEACCAAVWRLRPNGTLDRSFGVDGKAVTALGRDPRDPGRRTSVVYSVEALAVDRAGRIVVTSHDQPGPGARFGVARFTPDGRRDRRFGADGATATSFGASERPWALALQADGRIVVAGGTGGNEAGGIGTGAPRAIALARYLPPPCAVPQLRGRTQAGAALALRNSGCTLGRVTTTFSPTVPRGRVVSQQHRPLATLREDAPVAIAVSRGPRR